MASVRPAAPAPQISTSTSPCSFISTSICVICTYKCQAGAETVSTKNVQNTHINAQIRELHGALVEIVGVMNRPQRDEAMVREAGISLDRALFPLLVLVERLGPIGVVELADRVGRDYTTVSRQVAKLDSLGLVERQENANDRRVREAVITAKGKAMTDRIDTARERMGQGIFAKWEHQDVADLVRLTRRFADDLKGDD
ncbi:winged helix-turn-helix transcriptional regulator [Pseudomonas gingeri]|nr:winged helix-turn-helix transcriptional regulator [Pseudomonas gingeri]NVZ76701.1 winged helix-turn-helix transcriptional regulator [Pseudomonas gingeri]